MSSMVLRLNGYDIGDPLEHQVVAELVHDQFLDKQLHALGFVGKVQRLYEESYDMFTSAIGYSENHLFQEMAKEVRRCRSYGNIHTLRKAFGNGPARTGRCICKNSICPHCHARKVGLLYRGLCTDPTLPLYVYHHDVNVPLNEESELTETFLTYREALSQNTAHVKGQGRCFTGTRVMFDSTSHSWSLRLFAISSVPLGGARPVHGFNNNANAVQLSEQKLSAADFLISGLPGRFLRYDPLPFSFRFLPAGEMLAEITSCGREYEYVGLEDQQ